MESVSPNIFVKDIQKTIAFYQILGFEVNEAVPDKDNPIFVLMTNGKTTFMFQTFTSIGEELPPVSRQDGGSLLLYIKMNGIYDFYEKIKDKVTIYKGLEKTFYGATEFSIVDINNYMLTFAEHEE
ncbi:MAG: VOC family protein [Bacteroidales bacterium]|nr:VOC family protein [Bacteroidales bacterium]